MLLASCAKQGATMSHFPRPYKIASLLCLMALLGYSGHGAQAQASNADAQPAISAKDALHQCDTLAAHPDDPGRYTSGVPDNQFAPGAAIEACEPAVKLNPESARARFELGRAYWAAQRDDEAFKEFVDAANRGYAPAKKYIGDAFLTGRGLPSSEHQNARNIFIAERWYKESCAKLCDPSITSPGFPPARDALHDAEDQIAHQKEQAEKEKIAAEKKKFDPTIFQNPDFMNAIYRNTFDADDGDLTFDAYALAVAGVLAGDQMFFIDQSCKPLMTLATNAAISQRILALLGLRNDFNVLNPMQSAAQNPLGVLFGSWQSGMNLMNSDSWTKIQIYANQGENDTVALEKRYNCTSEVAKTIAYNLTSKYSAPPRNLQKLDSAGGASSKDESSQDEPSETAAPSTGRPQPITEVATDSTAYRDGKDDRARWETWVATLGGEARDGALYWAAERNNKTRHAPPSCSHRAGRTSDAFREACITAAEFLKDVDKRRSSGPAYRRGFDESGGSAAPTTAGPAGNSQNAK